MTFTMSRVTEINVFQDLWTDQEEGRDAEYDLRVGRISWIWHTLETDYKENDW